MNSKKRFLSVLVGALFIISLVASPLTLAQPPKSITVVDSLGRTIEIPYPVERIVNVNYLADEVFVALGGEDKLVGIDLVPTLMPEFYPTLKDKPTVGLHHFPSYEKIIELEPQVVIFCSMLTFLPGLEEKMKAAGIKSVVLDLWVPQTYDQDVRALGRILGKEKRAEEYLNFAHSYIDMVEQRVKDLPSEEKARVFWEFHFPYLTMAEGSPQDMLMEMAGGVNIFAETGGQKLEVPTGIKVPARLPARMVSPEAILEANPQVMIGEFIPMAMMTAAIGVMLRGEIPSIPIGYGSNPDVSILANMRDETMNRPETKATDAGREGRVYIFPFGQLLTSPRWAVGVCYLAKILHPDLFPDLDPEALHKEWIENWLGVEYQGVFIYPQM